jgi:hypothetical protein
MQKNAELERCRAEQRRILAENWDGALLPDISEAGSGTRHRAIWLLALADWVMEEVLVLIGSA